MCSASFEVRRDVFLWLCLVQLMALWLLHHTLVMCAVGGLKLGQTYVNFEFDLEQATLAPVWQRLAATVIDLCLLAIVLTLTGVAMVQMVSSSSSDSDVARWANQIRPVFDELSRVSGIEEFTRPNAVGPAVTLSSSLPQFVVEHCIVVCGMLMVTVTYFVMTIILEKRYGLTPGKMIIGVQCTGVDFSTPDWFAVAIRSLTRPLEYGIVLTPIPAVLMMLTSKHRRPFGDFLAGTILIKKRFGPPYGSGHGSFGDSRKS